MKFSALSGWNIIGTTTTAAGTLVRVELPTALLQCWHCGAPSEFLREYGETELRVKDVPYRGKPVELSLALRRYICSDCNDTSLQPMPGIDENFRATVRLVKLAAERAFSRPVSQVATGLGLPENFVRAAFSDEVERLGRLECFEAPRHLRLDVIRTNERERVVLSDVEPHRVIGITADACSITVYKTLFSLPAREHIETVTLPMSPPLREAAKRVLPRAHLIIDRFCVMRLGNQAFETAREKAYLYASRPKDVRVLEAAAYFLKARFIDVFRTDSSSVARRRYAEWVAGVPEELMFAFRPVMRRVNDWSEEIFGYFDHYFPQADDEGKAIQPRPHRPSNVVPDLSRPVPGP